MLNSSKTLCVVAAVACWAWLGAACTKPTGRANVAHDKAPPSAAVVLTSIPPDVRAAATAGITNQALADVLALHWDARMHRDPIWAELHQSS